MPIPEIIRDSFIGQVVYYASGRRLFQYPEERPGFVLPPQYQSPASLSRSPSAYDCETLCEGVQKTGGQSDPKPSEPKTIVRDTSDEEKSDSKTLRQPSPEQLSPDLVTWYGPDDQENPYNWSFFKRCLVTFDICILTFSIYIGSALYAPGIGGLAAEFGVSETAASLGLTMFVFGYGVGPMFLSPLSEIPSWGRTSIYIVSLLIFVLLQIPTALVDNLGSFLPLRFLAGFMASPALSTGGATLTDMWGPEDRAVVIGLWALFATCGPVFGPLVGGFAVQAKGWRWSIWILLWLSGAALAFLAFFLPETSAQAILHRRAYRLRRLTGNEKLKTQGDMDTQHLSLVNSAMTTLVRPFIMCFREPVVAFWNVYLALVYGILYIFIESFRVVFSEMHGFNLGENGLAFLGFFFGAVISYAFFAMYLRLSLIPKFNNGTFVPEDRLVVAMVGGTLLPISMFWFGWTSSPSIHWIVPIIASSFFCAGAFLLFQAGLNYLPDCYPRYVASVMAGNTLFRASFGAAFPLFSTAFFHNLGVGPACSLLGGVAILMLIFPFVLYHYGARVRSWSKYAD